MTLVVPEPPVRSVTVLLPPGFTEQYPFGACYDCLSGRCRQKAGGEPAPCVPPGLAVYYQEKLVFVSIWPCAAVNVQRGLCVKCTWAEDLGDKADRLVKTREPIVYPPRRRDR